MFTAVKRLQYLVGLRVNYNYRDSSLRAHFWKIRAGTKICDFLPLFQTDLKNCPQDINDEKDIQFHGVVINNRLFNLIHLVQEKKFSLFSFNHVQGLQGLCHVRSASECRPHVQHVLAPKTICIK